jgi:ketosteroid isomerase-like protein
MLLASAALALITVPGITAAGAGTGAGSDEDARLVADAIRIEGAVVTAYNDRNWDEFGRLYTEDALLVPPNHDAVRGRDDIVGYVRGLRDVFGPIDGPSIDHLRVQGVGGKLALVLENFTTQSGHIRVTDLSTYERQPDGSVLLSLEQFGFQEHAVG